MNEGKLFPPIFVWEVGRSAWQRSFAEEGIHFERCYQEISACARRLAKGVNRSEERLRLLQWYEHVVHLVQEMPLQGHTRREHRIPEPQAHSWAQMLSDLAKSRAGRAASQFKKEQLPHFLPCIWAPPSLGQSASSTQYGDQTVEAHIQELEQEMKIPQHLSDPDVRQMMRLRLDLFCQAFNNQSGIVEVVGSLFDGWSPHKGQKV